ncbi:hypothetical protein ENUP19_0149G0013 [Entamoeba nuttalli]|uniref:BRCT domain-containing protein n=2 Tax=Entamoeba nuttalli TaxID=412467 RepID=K2H4L1_ENTNP|nr:hypothetical protein ENU1_062790 [Entamoeba nuttalli P19]EKE41252.1 hypothetical protein ENU1_062790 [Entamoeba nuttalli P19]|eukprot:XP_008856416.1 hypothetical protein ENU1_062790 [Entamoeba nuttalli P19]
MSRWYMDISIVNNNSKLLRSIDDEVKCITLISENEYLIICTNGKIFCVDDKSSTEIGIEESAIGTILFNGKYYIASPTKLYLLENKQLKEQLSFSNQCSVIAASNDKIFVGLDGKIVKVYNEEFKEEKEFDIPEIVDIKCNGNTAVIITKKGTEIISAISYESLSPIYFSGGRMKVYGIPNSCCITPDGDYVLVGTENGKITSLVKDDTQFTFYAHCNRETNTTYKVSSINYYKENVIISTGMDGDINAWNLKDKDIISSVQTKEEIICGSIMNGTFAYATKGKDKYNIFTLEIEQLLNEVKKVPNHEKKTNRSRRKNDAIEEDKPKNMKEKKEKMVNRRLKKKTREVPEVEENFSNEIDSSSDNDEEDIRKKPSKHRSSPVKAKSGLFVFIISFEPQELINFKKAIYKHELFGITTKIEKANVIVNKHGQRTAEVLDAILRNIPIVEEKWVLESHKKMAVEPFEPYLMKDKFPALSHTTFDKSLLQNKTVGIYGGLKIRDYIIKKWIEQIGGKFATRAKYSDILLVGKSMFASDATRRTEGFAVKEEWLYDCISEMKFINPKSYLVDGVLKKEKENELTLEKPVAEQVKASSSHKSRSSHHTHLGEKKEKQNSAIIETKEEKGVSSIVAMEEENKK